MRKLLRFVAIQRRGASKIAWVYHPDYACYEGWDDQHRFNMQKYHAIYKQLVSSGIIRPSSIWAPQDPPGNGWLEVSHCPQYVAEYCSGTLEDRPLRRIGLPWSLEMVRAIRLEVAGTVLAAKLALQCGVACSLGGGTHHAHYSFGAGFNVFNDLALAALTLLQSKLVESVLVVDLDVHQGDGTAAILKEELRATTFSMHSAKAFPLRKSKSSLDVEFENGISDDEYLYILQESLPKLLDTQARSGIVLYDAGVDVHERDSVRRFCRGYLSLTSQGIRRRDRFVLEQCIARGLPVATVIGGGYSSDLEELVGRHCIHAEVAHSLTDGYY